MPGLCFLFGGPPPPPGKAFFTVVLRGGRPRLRSWPFFFLTFGAGRAAPWETLFFFYLVFCVFFFLKKNPGLSPGGLFPRKKILPGPSRGSPHAFFFFWAPRPPPAISKNPRRSHLRGPPRPFSFRMAVLRIGPPFADFPDRKKLGENPLPLRPKTNAKRTEICPPFSPPTWVVLNLSPPTPLRRRAPGRAAPRPFKINPPPAETNPPRPRKTPNFL